jgi:hypothetical protein
MPRRKKVTPATMSLQTLALMPGMLDVKMYDVSASVFRPDVKRLVTGNPAAAEAFVAKYQAYGFLTEEELEEQQNIIRGALKRNNNPGEYDPASVANKKSGYGQKPSRKPTRDYQAPASVRNNGTYVGTRTGAGWTP